MTKNNVISLLSSRKQNGKKCLAILVDPDKMSQLAQLLDVCKQHTPDLFLVGGSFRGDEQMSDCIKRLRQSANIPVVLFPGNHNQVVRDADAVMLLSVISSRNADLLIGRQVEAALKIRQSELEVIPTGYILVESGKLTTVQYMSQSLPVPRNKPELAAATAMAGEQLGLKAIYLEAGSGADQSVPSEMIKAVAGTVAALLFAVGGFTTAGQLESCFGSGADIAVIGNALEQRPALLQEFITIRDKCNA
jgi:phosphoglycerol geranylgeranyltransferase